MVVYDINVFDIILTFWVFCQGKANFIIVQHPYPSDNLL